MPKSSTKSGKVVAVAAAVTPTTTPIVEVKSTTSEPKKSKSTKSAKAAEITPTNVSATAPVESAGSPDIVLTETFGQFLGKLQTLASQMNALKTEFRVLEKKATRELKAAMKINARRKRKSGNRSPSGFVKPTLISDELAKFLSKPSGTEMARTEVTREINTYIRAHNLQDKKNGRKINPDESLAGLLKIGDGEELTYFNLQRYMSPHFAKASAKLPPAPT